MVDRHYVVPNGTAPVMGVLQPTMFGDVFERRGVSLRVRSCTEFVGRLCNVCVAEIGTTMSGSGGLVVTDCTGGAHSSDDYEKHVGLCNCR